MSPEERQQQFKSAIKRQPQILKQARIAENFGFSNSARVIEGGLFACTNNLETHSEKMVEGTGQPMSQLVLLSVLTFPPQDEVYFAILIKDEIARVEIGLQKLFREVQERNRLKVAAGKDEGRINNNVKFFITDTGHIFFQNEFRESLSANSTDGPLDEDCLAKIDSILFAIWPPAASARRSLLAREFVGYLGSLIGRERVHELRVWADAAAVSPQMQRLPPSIPLAQIENDIRALGGYYPDGEIGRFHAALNFLPHKHFVILSGLSGTGKTQLAIKYARAVHGVTAINAPDPFLIVCPVRPEWTDPTGLTGYEDMLTSQYIVPPFLEAVLLATAHADSPVFVVLDEMNLARVEYYFSDVLSAIETGEELQLHSRGVPLEGSTGTSIPAALPIPSNLYIIGTVNIDETTNPISDKVLDRALVIDMSAVDLSGFLTGLQAREPALAPAITGCQKHLLTAQWVMAAHGLGFGYRVAEEVVRYHAFASQHLLGDSSALIDDLMVQKVLLKLRGGERQRPLLTSLMKALDGFPRARSFLTKLAADLDEFGSFQASR